MDEEEEVLSLSIESAQTLLNMASDIFEHGDLKEKRELVHTLIDYIELIDEKVVINWAFA